MKIALGSDHIRDDYRDFGRRLQRLLKIRFITVIGFVNHRNQFV